jgi:hypothetical protein
MTTYQRLHCVLYNGEKHIIEDAQTVEITIECEVKVTGFHLCFSLNVYDNYSSRIA